MNNARYPLYPLVLLSLILLQSCGDQQVCCVSPKFVNVRINYTDSTGSSLLNPDYSNSFPKGSLNLYFKTAKNLQRAHSSLYSTHFDTALNKYVFDFSIEIENSKMAFIEFPGYTNLSRDTVKIDGNESSQYARKIQYNGHPLQAQQVDSLYFFTIIKNPKE